MAEPSGRAVVEAFIRAIEAMISIAEVHGGRSARTTTYYAAPFPAPDWRAPYGERMEVPHG